MPRYLYTVWFRDELAADDDQDQEWPACFVVDASSAQDAHSWGDHLARSFSAKRESEIFLRSELEERIESKQDTLPVIVVGHEASDVEIGW
jgi:hypothetical protein